MFGMTFINAALWTGAAGLALPLLIHLLTRRTPRRLVFPTIAFLQRAHASQSRLFRLRHWLLLLLRTLLLAAVLFAFLKPVHYRNRQAADDRNAARAAVIILDTSASMAYREHGLSVLEHGRQAAARLLDNLRGAPANLIFARAHPQPAGLELSNNAFELRKALNDARVTPERADFDAALREALRLLNGAPQNAQREIQIVSDFQRSNWSAVDFSGIPESIQTRFIHARPRPAENLAITDVAVIPPEPVAGEPVSITCKLSNYTSRHATVPVTLLLGSNSFERRLDVAAGMSHAVTFQIQFRNQGFHEGECRIGADGLEFDDRRHFVVRVAERLDLLIVSDEPDNDQSALHWIRRALNPYPQDERGALRPRVARGAELTPQLLAGTRIVILSGAQTLDAARINTLAEFVGAGGSLLLFLTGESDARNYALLAAAASGQFTLPFECKALIDRGGGQLPPGRIAAANFDHELLRKFRESVEFSQLQFYRYFRTERNEQQGEALIRFEDGNIACAKKSFNLGNLLVCNFSPALDAGDLAKSPLFLPLLHEMIRLLRPSGAGGQGFTAGGMCSTTIDAGPDQPELQVEAPSGRRVPAVIDYLQNEASIIIGRSEELGQYRVLDADKKIGAIAVNLDTRESNLEALAAEQLQQLSRRGPARLYSTDSADLDALERLLHGTPLWHWFVLTAFLLLVAEQLLVWFWKF